MPRVLEIMGTGNSAATARSIHVGVGQQLAATAAGAAQGTALAIAVTTDYVQVTTAAASTGVRLPTSAEGSVVGDVIEVTNNGANAITLYPGTGEFLNGLAVNTGISVAVGAGFRCTRRSATLWSVT
jgi:hypothetical protein